MGDDQHLIRACIQGVDSLCNISGSRRGNKRYPIHITCRGVTAKKSTSNTYNGSRNGCDPFYKDICTNDIGTRRPGAVLVNSSVGYLTQRSHLIIMRGSHCDIRSLESLFMVKFYLAENIFGSELEWGAEFRLFHSINVSLGHMPRYPRDLPCDEIKTTRIEWLNK